MNDEIAKECINRNLKEQLDGINLLQKEKWEKIPENRIVRIGFEKGEMIDVSEI